MMAVSEAFQKIHTIFEVRTFQDKSSGMRFVARRRSRVHNTRDAQSHHNEQTIAGANHFSSELGCQARRGRPGTNAGPTPRISAARAVSVPAREPSA
jgi:hypothetical protein